PHGLAVVDGVLGLGIGEVEPLLQEVDAEHLLESQGRPSLLALPGVVWFDESDEPLPWDDSVHLGEEPLAASDLALGVPCQSGERPLLSHALYALEVRVRCACLTNIARQTELVQRFLSAVHDTLPEVSHSDAVGVGGVPSGVALATVAV